MVMIMNKNKITHLTLLNQELHWFRNAMLNVFVPRKSCYLQSKILRVLVEKIDFNHHLGLAQILMM